MIQFEKADRGELGYTANISFLSQRHIISAQAMFSTSMQNINYTASK